MAAGSSSQQNFRKAIGAIKDSTSVGLAKVNNDYYKDLNVSILKATNHVEVLPKEKHVRIILGAVSGSRPRADVSFCIHALSRRLAKTHTWVVALKTLIVIHRALREVDHSFCEELIIHNKGRGHFLNLLHLNDDSSPNAWDYSAWIRTYALYIEECLECFRVLKYDFHRDHSRTKKLDTPALLEHLPALQSLLFRLLGCEPIGATRYNFMIQYAISIVAAESVRLYVAITDGVLVLVDKFFEMQRPDAVKALEIYRKSGEQAQRLSEFFEMCRNLDFGRRQKYVKIEQPPASFLKVMEEYITEAPQQLTLPTLKSDIEMPKLITAAPDSNQDEKTDDECTETNNINAAPLIPDLLSWDEPSQEESVSDIGVNFPPLSLDTPVEGMSEPEVSSEPASWELALAATTTLTTSSSLALNKGGVLDRSLLDSLYDAALTQQAIANAPPPPNPFESHTYDSSPNYDQQQLVPFTQHHQDLNQQQPTTEYMQMVGILPHQQELSLVSYHYNQQQQELSSFAGQDFIQMNEFPPQLQVSNENEIPPMVGVDSTSASRNPFDDPPQSQLADGPSSFNDPPPSQFTSGPQDQQQPSSNFSFI